MSGEYLEQTLSDHTHGHFTSQPIRQEGLHKTQKRPQKLIAGVMAQKVSLKSLTIDKMSKLSLKPDSKFCNEEPIAFLDDPATAAMMQ